MQILLQATVKNLGATFSKVASNLSRWDCIRVPVPQMGESITEGSIQCWNKQVGDSVEPDEVLAIIDTDKISVDVSTPAKGMLKKIFGAEGDTVIVGDDLFEIDTEATGTAAARETTTTPPEKAGLVIGVGERTERRTPLSRMRIRIGERLKSAQDNGVLLTTFQECDMSKVMELRKKLGPAIKDKHDVKLGFMSFFIAACSESLKLIPALNCQLDQNEMIEKNYVDISIAVATPTGLTVPVLRNVEKMTLVDMERELASLAAEVRAGSLPLEKMQGGNFTISNGGVYGSLMGTPIINPPQAAILGMHSIIPRAVVRDGQVVIRPIMNLALTYDHKLVDGREAVLFLKNIAALVEEPERLLESVKLD